MQIKRLQKYLKDVIPEFAFKNYSSKNPFIWKSKIKNIINKLAYSSFDHVYEVTKVKVGDKNSLHTEYISFKTSACITIKAILLRPFGDGIFPFILICPGRNSVIERLTGLSPSEYEGENISELLSKNGFATLTVDYGIVGSINPVNLHGRDEIDLLSLAASLLQLSPMGMVLNDLLYCLSWIETQRWYDQKGVGIFGRSIGGFIATYLALLYKNTTSVALSNCLCSYPSLFDKSFPLSSISVLPGILRYADFPDLISVIAPMPLHLQISANDPIYSYAEGIKVSKQIHSAYELFNVASSLETYITKRHHGTDAGRVVEFFKKNQR